MSEETSGSANEQTQNEESEMPVTEEAEEQPKKQLPADFYYNYEELHSRPFVTPDSEISENLLSLCHSFGYDSGRRANLQPLDENTLIFIAGNVLVLLDTVTKKQRYLRSCGGEGIGAIAVSPSKDYFAVAEVGKQPNILLYEYPSLRLYRILRGGTERAYSCLDFNNDGSLLASVGNAPDFTLTLWIWKNEQILLRCKAISQDVFRVSFSMYREDSVTSAGYQHIKFWKVADTFTGLKLKGSVGHFGKFPATDIEGFVELPDGKVVSGSIWGNLLLWDGCIVKVEICRKKGRNCHAGVVQPFAFEDGQLLTMGRDGVIRIWDFESTSFADVTSDSSRFEMEPINELLLGHNVSLTSVVKSPQPNSFVWFAQDSKGAIWKLDLSFTYTTPDPECLFSFHAGPIMGLDVSWRSHLMVTTALDHSVRIFDLLAKAEVTSSRFNQGGTAVLWAPSSVDTNGGLLVTGFEDGVVRLLELYDPQKLYTDTGFSPTEPATLHLKQAFKPHNAPVTAVAYEPRGKILATGSSDKTVFFFSVGERYHPIGFIQVPGPVQGLEWSSFPRENKLLILCQSGHVVEAHRPNPKVLSASKSFHLPELPRRSFRFRSIKSRIKREIEMARRQTAKEKKRKRDEEKEESGEQDEEQEEENQKELPPIYIPKPPSPLCCGFYSQPGQFWLSMGGFDSGFLYHCKFSKHRDEDPDEQQDEPFDFLPVDNGDNDPICSISFSTNRQLMLCGMHSGSIRVYPLQQGDHSLESMSAYWTLSVHDNQSGHVKHIRSSYDDQFVLTAGDDGNIFSFSILPPEGQQRRLRKKMAMIPLPREHPEDEAIPQDIDDPSAYSIETAKQKMERDSVHQKAKVKVSRKRKQITELQKEFKQLLNLNESLPEHLHLTHEELHRDQHFTQQAEREKEQRVKEVKEQMSWEVERSNVALKKLQDWFRDSFASVVTVEAIGTSHSVSTFHVPALVSSSLQLREGSRLSHLDEDGEGDYEAVPEYGESQAELAKDGIEAEDEMVLHSRVARSAGVKLGDRQMERLQKAAEKAEQAQAKIEKRKEEWSQLYAEKPNEDCEDPQDVEAIRVATETIGDLKLKSAKDYNVPKHLRMNPEGKREQLKVLEEKIRKEQVEVNKKIVALRDSKIHLVSQLHLQAQQIREIQRQLPARLRRPLPPLPTVLPSEIPEKRLQPSRAVLERYQFLAGQMSHVAEHQKTARLLERLEKELEGKEEKKEADLHETTGEGEEVEEEACLGEQERMEEEEEDESHKMMEAKLLHELDPPLQQMESSICQFDRELQLLHREKLRLYPQLKLADLRQLTLYQELRLLQEFEGREEKLQEKLSLCIKEENSITSKLNASLRELEMKQAEVTKVQDRERSLAEAFQETVADNPFEEFLTKVFKKMVKRDKKKEREGGAEEEEDGDSDEDSDEDSDWDDDFDSAEEGEAPLSDSVCPPGCDPELFENTLHLRELRLDLEELVAEKKKNAEALKKMCDTVVKKEKVVKHNRKAAEDSLDLVYREKQQRMNELDVVVPLRLSQIVFDTDRPLTSDLGQALLLNMTELKRLQRRTKELQEEIKEHKALHRQARHQHIKLIKDQREMDTQTQVLEEKCYEDMMTKFGRLVDLEALQTLSGNRKLEELRQRKILKEIDQDKELKEWDARVREERQALLEVIERNTELLQSSSRLIEEKRQLNEQIRGRQTETDWQKCVDEAEIQRLQNLVETHSKQIKALKKEIHHLHSAPQDT